MTSNDVQVHQFSSPSQVQVHSPKNWPSQVQVQFLKKTNQVYQYFHLHVHILDLKKIWVQVRHILEYSSLVHFL